MRALHILACLLLFLTPAVAASPERESAVAPAWPERFFAGRTEGKGDLTVLLSPARKLRVHSRGRLTGNGTLVLRQKVEVEGEAPATREWRIRRDRNNRYSGTLSDASGPVTGEVSSDQLHLRYGMKGGLRIEQWLTLEPGGSVVRNRLVVRKLGLPVARLNEIIRKTR